MGFTIGEKVRETFGADESYKGRVVLSCVGGEEVVVFHGDVRETTDGQGMSQDAVHPNSKWGAVLRGHDVVAESGRVVGKAVQMDGGLDLGSL